MMTGSSSGISRAAAAKLYSYQPAERTTRPAETSAPHQYDSLTISAAPTGESRFQKELVSRISHEIRTSTTTGDIQMLRNQVASGTYQVDPSAIAARMLYLAEV